MIPRTTIDAIREKIDIVELVESKGISLKRTGSRYVGLCPVHSERTPSFNVNSQSQTFHCFGCGISGDAIAFLIEVDSYTFTGAVEALGDMAGIEVVDSAGEDPDYLRKKDYLRCVGSAAWFYRTRFAELPESHPAKQDLAGRKYLHVEGRETWLEDFGMGYAPGNGNLLSSFLMSQGYSKEQILDAGLAFENERNGQLRDRFRNRLTWEIRDIKGRPIGFSGRRLNEEDNPKYLNTPETILYKKSKTLLGIDLARKKMAEDRVCYVTEGAADVMAVAATGYTNVVASCGTGFGSEHAAIIRRVIDDFDSKNNGKFVFVFDGDAAGLKAAMKMFTDIKPSIKDRSYVASLDELDPVDFRKEHGDDALRQRLVDAEPITEFMLKRIASKYDMSRIESRSGFTKEAMQLLSHIDEIDIFEAYKRKVSAMSGVSIGHLRGGHVPEAPEPRYEDRYDGPPPEYHEYDPYEPVDPFEAPPEGVAAEHSDSLDKASELLVACLLQFPNQTFGILRDKSHIAGIIQNDRLKRILIEGMNKTGFTAIKGQETRLTISDFSDGGFVTQFFHLPLDVKEGWLENYVNRLVKHMEGLESRRTAENLRAAVATREIAEADALAQILAQRKKRKQ